MAYNKTRATSNTPNNFVSVLDFGAKGDGITDDSDAIQLALDTVGSTNTGGTTGGTVYMPPGIYQINKTLLIQYKNVSLKGSGKVQCYIRRSQFAEDTLLINETDRGPVNNIEVSGMTFLDDSGDPFYDDKPSTTMTGAHIVLFSVQTARLEELDITNGAAGIRIYGGADISLNKTTILGRFDADNPKWNSISALALYNSETASPKLPTQIKADGLRIGTSGERIKGPRFGLLANAGEQVTFTNSYFGNCATHNVYIQQIPDNPDRPDDEFDVQLLEFTFGTGCYIDGAGNHAVCIAGETASGDNYIGNVKFIGCDIKGQSGDSLDGIHVRAGLRSEDNPYRESLRGLIVNGCTISGHQRHGIYLGSCTDAVITGNSICGNNYFGPVNDNGEQNGSGITVSSFTDNVVINSNAIGKDSQHSTPGSASDTAWQQYGVYIEFGVTNTKVIYNDLTGNKLGEFRNDSNEPSVEIKNHIYTTSVTDFGADPTGATDSSDAVQAAIDSCDGVNQTEIHCVGIFKLEKQIILKSRITLTGGGTFFTDADIEATPGGFPEDTHCGLFKAQNQIFITIRDLNFNLNWQNGISQDTGPRFSARTFFFDRCGQINVKDCEFNTTGGAVAGIACYAFSVTGNSISALPSDNNTDKTTPADGQIDFWGELGNVQDFVISNNRIAGNTRARWGIMLTGLREYDEFGNVLFVGVIKNGVVSNNIVTQCFYDGIWTFGRNGGMDGISITSNTVSECRHGIQLSDAYHCSVTANTCLRNRQYDIYLTSEDPTDDGTDDDYIKLKYCSVTANVVAGSNLDPSGIGIYATKYCMDNIISANQVRFKEFAIAVGNTCFYNYITDNVVNGIVTVTPDNYCDRYLTNTDFAFDAPANMTNVDSVSGIVGNVTVSQDYIKVDGEVNVDFTAANTFTTINMEYPIALREAIDFRRTIGNGVTADGDTVRITGADNSGKLWIQLQTRSSSILNPNGTVISFSVTYPLLN